MVFIILERINSSKYTVLFIFAQVCKNFSRGKKNFFAHLCKKNFCTSVQKNEISFFCTPVQKIFSAQVCKNFLHICAKIFCTPVQK